MKTKRPESLRNLDAIKERISHIFDDLFLERLIEKIPDADVADLREAMRHPPRMRVRGNETAPVDVEYVLAGYARYLATRGQSS